VVLAVGIQSFGGEIANPNGVQHGIEKAEAKQSLHKGSKKANKGKSKDKHKSRTPSSASH
jgi:hypothetical protein